jgi:co-chaperonin GroES (HSP10)
MSNLILPPGIVLPHQLQQKEAPNETDTDEEKATVLPEPSGYKLLCIVPNVSDKIEGSVIVKASEYARQEEHSTTVLFVVKVGPDAYKDKNKFPSGPWAKQGDFVVVRAYGGTRLKIYGKEFRLINDDQVEAVVADPRGVTRA